MPEPKPPATIEDYKNWAKETLGVDFDSAVVRREYDREVRHVESTAFSHPFFREIEAFLKESQEIYRQEKNADLLMSQHPPVTLCKKSYDSMVNKSFRHNFINKKSFPSIPTDSLEIPQGWVSPDNWFLRINDTVRTRIVCKYVDGPKFLAERLANYSDKHRLSKHYESQQKDDGYYAYHFYVTIPVDTVSKDRKPLTNDVEIEIQLTTQLQEVISHITHQFYEDTRIHKESDPNAWKWEFESYRFRAGYLSHTLHLLEAIIVEIRNASLKPHEK